MSYPGVLNLPVAKSICQLIIEDKVYFEWFKRRYAYCQKINRVNWQVLLKRTGENNFSININPGQYQAIVHLPKKRTGFNQISFFTEVAIASLVIRQNIIFLHASSLVINDKAYVFCGRVGEGKSTIRKLGSNYSSLSDDTTVIKKEGNLYLVYPSPFDKRVCLNLTKQKTFLSKIFILCKSDNTKIVSISSLDAINHLIRNNLLSYNKKIKSKRTFYLLNIGLATTVPIHKLYFTKSREFLDII